MVMWVSKSLGHGFRVGTTIRTRPTQAQLKILENAKFVENIQKRFREAFADYLLQNGYYVADMQDLVGAEIEDDVYNPVKISLDEFKDVMRLIQDGGNLTEKRKERLLKSVYGIEDLLTSNNVLKELQEQLTECNKEWSIFSSKREKIKARKRQILSDIKLNTKKFISLLPEEKLSAIPIENKAMESFFQKYPKLGGFLLSILFWSVIGAEREAAVLQKMVWWYMSASIIFYIGFKKDFISANWVRRTFILLGTGFWIFLLSFAYINEGYPIRGSVCVVCGDGYVTEYNGVPLLLSEKDFSDYKEYIYRGRDFAELKKWILKNTKSRHFRDLAKKDSMNDLDEQIGECRKIELFTIFNHEFCRAYSYYLEHEKYTKSRAKEYAYASAYSLLSDFVLKDGAYKQYMESLNKIMQGGKNFPIFKAKEHVKMLNRCFPSKIKGKNGK